MNSIQLTSEERHAIYSEDIPMDSSGYIITPAGLNEAERNLLHQALTAYAIQIHGTKDDLIKVGGVTVETLRDTLKSILRLQIRLDCYGL